VAATISGGIIVLSAHGTGRQVSSLVANNAPWMQLKAETAIQILQPLLDKVFLSISGTFRASGACLQL